MTTWTCRVPVTLRPARRITIGARKQVKTEVEFSKRRSNKNWKP